MKIKPYQYYLFDSDGTLLDTAELIFQSFLYTCEKYGDFTIERPRVIADIGQPLVRQIQLYLGQLPDNDLKSILDDFRDYQLSIYQDHLSVFPGVEETLRQLKNRGKKLAVVTSRKLDTTEIYLKVSRLFDFFDVIISPESTIDHKPHPAPAFKALEMLNGNGQDALFIGDAYFDIECGQQAGIDTALVSWSQNDPNSIQPAPTYIIQQMSDLLD
ncbi:MAG: HAD-IA family hydrolase [Deltaproteobacteria bacterium]|jgi:pyrophosphatase PpaX|nr:HAD-IA family hydrolase [Deltaproteobacteria bacterium]MBT4269457.1 HAD-IA family hydrolase [Deltaproteobacteria bacterium]MBT4639333.1 HAD-IA family hydrolase [Deltaproteobacteria bacterium]MBT6504663.1 HAD-IA family hydrolase [Deltaproteobacteria bacterium]MBT6612835.1 HAD-IA family hydrolase [Deltaproteobacteria bacterium]